MLEVWLEERKLIGKTEGTWRWECVRSLLSPVHVQVTMIGQECTYSEISVPPLCPGPVYWESVVGDHASDIFTTILWCSTDMQLHSTPPLPCTNGWSPFISIVMKYPYLPAAAICGKMNQQYFTLQLPGLPSSWVQVGCFTDSCSFVRVFKCTLSILFLDQIPSCHLLKWLSKYNFTTLCHVHVLWGRQRNTTAPVILESWLGIYVSLCKQTTPTCCNIKRSLYLLGAVLWSSHLRSCL